MAEKLGDWPRVQEVQEIYIINMLVVVCVGGWLTFVPGLG